MLVIEIAIWGSLGINNSTFIVAWILFEFCISLWQTINPKL